MICENPPLAAVVLKPERRGGGVKVALVLPVLLKNLLGASPGCVWALLCSCVVSAVGSRPYKESRGGVAESSTYANTYKVCLMQTPTPSTAAVIGHFPRWLLGSWL